MIPFPNSSSAPVDPAALAATEKVIGFQLPQSYKELLCTLGSGGYDDYNEETGMATMYVASFNDPKDGRQDSVEFYEGVYGPKELERYMRELHYQPKAAIGAAETKKCLPFNNDACGNFVCFYYKEPDAEPSIVKYDFDYGLVPVCEHFAALMALVECIEDPG